MTIYSSKAAFKEAWHRCFKLWPYRRWNKAIAYRETPKLCIVTIAQPRRDQTLEVAFRRGPQ